MNATSRPRRLLGLAVLVGVCLGVGAVGGIATSSSVDTWYSTLNKPVFNPPNWLFAPVWTALYVLMAVAAWRVWCTPDGVARRQALFLFAVQLAFNLAWSFIFFAWRSPGWALVEIAVLSGLVALTLARFWSLDRSAGLLMVPYLVWVLFATALNLAIWRLN